MDPDPTTDPTPFFSDFKDAKKIQIFSYNLPAGTLSFLKYNFLLNFCIKIFFMQAFFHSAQHRKGKDADPYL
jgi:hypothetical protein